MKNLLHEHFPTLDERPQVWGIVNCTPDSFSDGGKFLSAKLARQRIYQLFAAGADAVDIGAESTRPGAQPVSEHEEWERLLPVLDGLLAELSQTLPGRRLTLSIDTQKPTIAARALDLGVSVINDVSAGADADLLALVARQRCPYVLMHTRGNPQNMMKNTDYGTDFFETFLHESRSLLANVDKAGILQSQVIFDPGIGFAKTKQQNNLLLRHLEKLQSLKMPILVGPSRKSFLRVPGAEGAYTEESGAVDLLDDLTLAACVLAVAKGARFLRVHRVEKTKVAVDFVNEVLKSV